MKLHLSHGACRDDHRERERFDDGGYDRPGWERHRDGPPGRYEPEPYHRGYEREYEEPPYRGGRYGPPPGDGYGGPGPARGYDYPPPPPPRRGYEAAPYERSYDRGYERAGFRPYDAYDEGLLPPPPPPRAPPPPAAARPDVPADAGDDIDPEREAFEADLRRELEKVSSPTTLCLLVVHPLACPPTVGS
jgi:hypothetical protein